jgi:AcrR family transcriptional regulator
VHRTAYDGCGPLASTLLAVLQRDPLSPLPRGPHRLTRAEVERSQRERLLAAMAAAVAEKGYANTAVADVLAGAGVSRATFYAQFRDKADCFLAAYRAAVELVTAVMAAELEAVRASGEPDPLARLERVLAVYLESLRGAPALAKTFLVEVYAAGPEAIRLRRQSLEGFADVVAETHRGEPGLLGTEPHQRFAAEVLVGAVSSMVTNLVGVEEFDRLPQLREPLMALARTLTEA